MRILFISRATLYKDKGGDTIQIVNTARYLGKLGAEVTIRLCNEHIDYSRFDIIHFFNIIRPADILLHIDRSGKPFVVSTIYVDYSEYEKNERTGTAGILFKIFSPDAIEYLKVIGRFIANGEKIVSTKYLLLGQKKSIKKIISGSGMLLPNSHSEYKRLSQDYNITKTFKVIPNAIDTSLFNEKSGNETRSDNLVICVGRIEGRKNQLNLIKALNGTEFRLVIIGSPSANQVKYYAKCKEIAAPNVSFVESVEQEELIDYYKAAKVHALPSWFETTGLSSLEAAAMGCNIVITEKGDTREYFENYAYYCDPGSPQSIFDAIRKAATNSTSRELQKKILNQYTWSHAAKLTLEAYEEIVRD
ncbi:MAG TPA: glycosyltransferase family 4 protein [Chitinophagaceae bacterium]|nr:glycosyltransferase family 4 protein [Chitinophagaceae bacterium]